MSRRAQSNPQLRSRANSRQSRQNSPPFVTNNPPTASEDPFIDTPGGKGIGFTSSSLTAGQDAADPSTIRQVIANPLEMPTTGQQEGIQTYADSPLNVSVRPSFEESADHAERDARLPHESEVLAVDGTSSTRNEQIHPSAPRAPASISKSPCHCGDRRDIGIRDSWIWQQQSYMAQKTFLVSHGPKMPPEEVMAMPGFRVESFPGRSHAAKEISWNQYYSSLSADELRRAYSRINQLCMAINTLFSIDELIALDSELSQKIGSDEAIKCLEKALAHGTRLSKQRDRQRSTAGPFASLPVWRKARHALKARSKKQEVAERDRIEMLAAGRRELLKHSHTETPTAEPKVVEEPSSQPLWQRAKSTLRARASRPDADITENTATEDGVEQASKTRPHTSPWQRTLTSLKARRSRADLATRGEIGGIFLQPTSQS